MVGVLALLTLVLPVVRSPLRVWLIAVGAIVVLTIGVGRVVLNVHHPSDVRRGLGVGLRVVRRQRAAGAARRPGHGNGRNTGSAR